MTTTTNQMSASQLMDAGRYLEAAAAYAELAKIQPMRAAHFRTYEGACRKLAAQKAGV